MNRSFDGRVLREDPAFEPEESTYRMESRVVRTGGGTVKPTVRQKDLRVAKCANRPIPFSPRKRRRHPTSPSAFACWYSGYSAAS